MQGCEKTFVAISFSRGGEDLGKHHHHELALQFVAEGRKTGKDL